MTVNPMQRRTRNSFILGFGVAILVAMVIVALLVVMMRKTSSELKKEKAKQRQLLVASADIKDSSVVNEANTVMENTLVSVNIEEVATLDDLTKEGEIILSRNRIPKGTVITKSMLYREEEKDMHNLRILELNMLMLPSRLEEGDVVDIRLALPSGENFIVLTKKIIEEADRDSIWIKATEEEILILNAAMVESYMVEGSKLEALMYANPGVQKAAAQTYPLSRESWEVIEANDNITEKARTELVARHNKTVGLRGVIANAKTAAMRENGLTRVHQAVADEISKMHEKREEYIEELTQLDF